MVSKKDKTKTNTSNNTEKSGNIEFIIENQEEPTLQPSDSSSQISELLDNPELAKKRGRKPKGGKLFTRNNSKANTISATPNIILHLKCSMRDLNEHYNSLNQIVTDPLCYNPVIPPNIMTYSTEKTVSFSEYIRNETTVETDNLNNEKFAYNEFDKPKSSSQMFCSSCNEKMELNDEQFDDEYSGINIKDINHKLKRLKINLYKNANPDKKSACFWCTYEYDNYPCYIPKYEMNNEIFGYGSFCRPECAVAYLMEENIDDSTKFERYHLLNKIYSKVYNFKKNIKPAPCPYFLLEKYYGNLSIQEYRKLLKTEHMLLTIDKPMTRLLPELHEDNEDFIMNIYGNKMAQNTNQSGVYKVKKSTDKQKGPSKSTIIKESFGFT
jgi:hypothetical protein